jgi:AraC family transcriptional regulator
MKKAFLITVAAIIFFAVTMFIRLGMYKEVKFEVRDLPIQNTLFVNHVGPYYKISEKISFVEDWAKQNGVPCEKTYGEFLDDLKATSEDRLRSRGGCVTGEYVSEKSYLPADASYGSIAAGKYLVGYFEGAPSVGPYTVYPKAFDWMKNNGFVIAGPVIEMYTVLNEKEVRTEYLFPIKK